MEEKNKSKFDAGYGLAVWLMLGVTIGVCLDNIALWMPLGLLVGITIDCGLKGKKDNKKQ